MSVPNKQNPLGLLWQRGMWKENGTLKGQLFSTCGDTSLTGVDPHADGSGIVNGNYMFYKCTGLTSWTVELPNLTDGAYMFQSCSGLTSWNVDLPNLTNGTYMFYGTSLTSWTVDLPKLTSSVNMFYGCRHLTSWTADLPKLTTGTKMFYACAALTSWTVDLPKLTNGTEMFYGCNLDASSVLQILTSIPDRAAAGLAVASLHIGKRTNYKDDDEVADLLGTVTPIAGGTYSCKGWTITVQN